MVDLLERIDVMLQQEFFFYKTKDYLSPEFQLLLSGSGDDSEDACDIFRPSSPSPADESSPDSSPASEVNETWRERIAQWSYEVIDHFNFSRELASISMHYLDRYLASKVVGKTVFQLAAMTTLFVAIKLYEPGNLSMEAMLELSRGYFTVAQMKEMELSILRVLEWRLSPPTSLCFAKHILFLLPYTSVSLDARHDTLELTRFLCELSVIDYYFVGRRSSDVAIAALLNAMQIIPDVSDDARINFESELRRVPGLDPNRQDVMDCRDRLRLLYDRDEHSFETEVRDEAISPVSVAHGCHPGERTRARTSSAVRTNVKDCVTYFHEGHVRVAKNPLLNNTPVDPTDEEESGIE